MWLPVSFRLAGTDVASLPISYSITLVRDEVICLPVGFKVPFPTRGEKIDLLYKH